MLMCVRKNYLILFCLIIILGTGCVPAKKIIYLQHEDELNNRDEIPTNEILRSRPLHFEEYTIQPLDVLQIQFLTLTDEEYDFFSRSTVQGRNNNSNNNGQANGILVDTDGNIEFPVIGKVNVGGLLRAKTLGGSGTTDSP